MTVVAALTRGWPGLAFAYTAVQVPMLAAMVRAFGPVELGVEYYGAYGPIGRFASACEQIHRLLGIIQAGFDRFAVHVGAGYGFAAGERVIVKAIVSVVLSREGLSKTAASR